MSHDYGGPNVYKIVKQKQPGTGFWPHWTPWGMKGLITPNLFLEIAFLGKLFYKVRTFLAATQVKVDGPVGTFFDPSIYQHFTAWKPVTVPTWTGKKKTHIPAMLVSRFYISLLQLGHDSQGSMDPLFLLLKYLHFWKPTIPQCTSSHGDRGWPLSVFLCLLITTQRYVEMIIVEGIINRV